jgi:hypothetical protein
MVHEFQQSLASKVIPRYIAVLACSNFWHVYWFSDFILAYMDFIEPIKPL